MTDTITKTADRWLMTWSKQIRSGNRVDMDYPHHSSFVEVVPGRDHNEDLAIVVDHIIGKMQEPMRRVCIRYYLDPIPGKRFLYYQQSYRTMDLKARSEKMGTTTFKDYLKIARHIVYYAMEQMKFNAAGLKKKQNKPVQIIEAA